MSNRAIMLYDRQEGVKPRKVERKNDEMSNDFDQSRQAYLDPMDPFDGEVVQPLLAAVEVGDLATVAKLLTAGESPNASDEDGDGLLHLAIQAGDLVGRMGELWPGLL